jgi:inward rectifier potassium channel
MPKEAKATPPLRAPHERKSRDRLPAFRIRRVGLARETWGDLYHFLIDKSWGRLLGLIAGVYIVANFAFAGLYLLGGNVISGAREGSFADAFFFSVQTLATIGYGTMSPATTYAHLLVTAEAFAGTLFAAVVTGLVFSKFSRPTSRVMWSDKAIITVRDGIPSLIIRVANVRANQIVEAQVRVALARNEKTKEGEPVRRFYDLSLVRDRNVMFVLSWTIIHPITETSPLYGMDSAALEAVGAQLILSLIGIDETFAQQVNARHAYDWRDIVWNHRFVDILREENGERIIDYSHFHDVEPDAPRA